jgi:hypothetical protein
VPGSLTRAPLPGTGAAQSVPEPVQGPRRPQGPAKGVRTGLRERLNAGLAAIVEGAPRAICRRRGWPGVALAWRGGARASGESGSHALLGFRQRCRKEWAHRGRGAGLLRMIKWASEIACRCEVRSDEWTGAFKRHRRWAGNKQAGDTVEGDRVWEESARYSREASVFHGSLPRLPSVASAAPDNPIPTQQPGPSCIMTPGRGDDVKTKSRGRETDKLTGLSGLSPCLGSV